MVMHEHGIRPGFVSLSPDDKPLPSCMTGTKEDLKIATGNRYQPALFVQGTMKSLNLKLSLIYNSNPRTFYLQITAHFFVVEDVPLIKGGAYNTMQIPTPGISIQLLHLEGEL